MHPTSGGEVPPNECERENQSVRGSLQNNVFTGGLPISFREDRRSQGRLPSTKDFLMIIRESRNATPPRFGDVLSSFRILNAPSILFF
jgi:hypothetical protein